MGWGTMVNCQQGEQPKTIKELIGLGYPSNCIESGRQDHHVHVEFTQTIHMPLLRVLVLGVLLTMAINKLMFNVTQLSS